MEKFDQRVVYANHVRIYRQIGRICEVSSDVPRYLQFRILSINFIKSIK